MNLSSNERPDVVKTIDIIQSFLTRMLAKGYGQVRIEVILQAGKITGVKLVEETSFRIGA